MKSLAKETEIFGLGGMRVDFPEGIPEVALCLMEADQNVYLLFGNKCPEPVEPALRCTD